MPRIGTLAPDWASSVKRICRAAWVLAVYRIKVPCGSFRKAPGSASRPDWHSVVATR